MAPRIASRLSGPPATAITSLPYSADSAHGIKQPATLHEDELEYQVGWKERRGRLESRFELKPPLVWNGNGKKGRERAAKAMTRG